MKVASAVVVFFLILGAGAYFLLVPSNNAAPPPATESAASETPSEPAAKNDATTKPVPAKAGRSGAPTAAGKAAELELAETQRQDLRRAFKSRDLEQAKEILLEMSKRNPGSDDVLSGQSKVLLDEGKKKEAIASIRKCAETFPNSRTCLAPYVGVSMAYGSQEDQEDAIAKCLAGIPNDSQCRVSLAQLRLTQKKFQEAAGLLRRLLQDNATNGSPPAAHDQIEFLLGEAMEGLGKGPDALVLFQRACEERNLNACKRLGR